MMMPANYSAIAENEMVYVEGGATLLNGAMPKKLSTFTTSVTNIIANTFMSDWLSYTLGQIFAPQYELGDGLRGIKDYVVNDPTKASGERSGMGKVTAVISGLAVVAQLANNDAVPVITDGAVAWKL